MSIQGYLYQHHLNNLLNAKNMSLLKEFKRSFSYTGIFLKTNIFGTFQSILKNS